MTEHPDSEPPRYRLRRYLRMKTGIAVQDSAIKGQEDALRSAHYLAMEGYAVAVIDADGEVVARFGDVPSEYG